MLRKRESQSHSKKSSDIGRFKKGRFIKGRFQNDDSMTCGVNLEGLHWNKANQLGGCCSNEMAAGGKEEAVYRRIWKEIS